MTLGQPMTFRGQIGTFKARLGPGESFGVIFSPVAAMGVPQSAVQNLAPLP